MVVDLLFGKLPIQHSESDALPFIIPEGRHDQVLGHIQCACLLKGRNELEGHAHFEEFVILTGEQISPLSKSRVLGHIRCAYWLDDEPYLWLTTQIFPQKFISFPFIPLVGFHHWIPARRCAWFAQNTQIRVTWSC